MVICKKVIDEIETKIRLIKDNPGYFLKRSHQVRNDLRAMGNVHSFWLENPKMRRQILEHYSLGNSQKLHSVARESIKRIESAWNYLMGNGVLLANITPQLIKDVGALVDSGNKQGFRDCRVSLRFESYTPPNPLRVPGYIEQFCSEIKRSDYHAVEAAAVAHLSIAGIQPFQDGNKRTARLLQDKILSDNNLPPAVIHSGEREVYLDLLEQGIVGLKSNDLKQQRPFFDYIGGKVNTALDEVIGDLSIKH